MSGNDRNSSFYSASDIQKYLSGELSAPEMHQLELAALEDPLLSDALEGMAIHPSLRSPSSFQQDLGELQKRLDNRVGKKDRKGVLLLFRSPWKVAAALILLLGLGLTAYFTFLNTARPRNAMAITQSSSTPSVPATADTITLKDQAEVKEQAVAKNFKKEEEAASGNTPKASGPAEGTLAREALPPAAAQKQAAVKEQAAPSPKPAVLPGTTVTQDDIVQAAPATTDKESYINKGRAKASYNYKEDSIRIRHDTSTGWDKYTSLDKQPAPPADNFLARKLSGLNITDPADQLVFTGKVTDQNNKPLPGASLHLKDNYLVNTTTDKNGFFSLRLPKTDSAAKLTVAYVGYEQASLGLSAENRTGNIIQLQPQDNALNEVVVTGFGSKRREIIRDNSKPSKEYLTKRAVPADGWPAYQSYLEVNKKAINPDSTLKGNETVSFLVNKEGGLSSFKVEQSLSPAHDSAAIHLIQQGPSWKLLKGKKTRAWVTIPF
ncbi:MAG TPA: carboxypeptidase-like regulatory domain-containing protein [Puia sp.]